MSLLRADARALPLRDGCVQCCVTSPPYFGLRSYMPNAVRVRDDLTPEDREYLSAELERLNIRPTSDVV